MEAKKSRKRHDEKDCFFIFFSRVVGSESSMLEDKV
jgi:hypothetical protein